MSSAVLLKTQMVGLCSNVCVTVTCRPRLLDRPSVFRLTVRLSLRDRVCMKLSTRVVLSVRYSLSLAVLGPVTSRPLCNAFVKRRSRVVITVTLSARDLTERLPTRHCRAEPPFAPLDRSYTYFLHLERPLESSLMVADPLDLDGLMTVAIRLCCVAKEMLRNVMIELLLLPDTFAPLVLIILDPFLTRLAPLALTLVAIVALVVISIVVVVLAPMLIHWNDMLLKYMLILPLEVLNLGTLRTLRVGTGALSNVKTCPAEATLPTVIRKNDFNRCSGTKKLVERSITSSMLVSGNVVLSVHR